MESERENNQKNKDVEKKIFYRHGESHNGIRFTICAIVDDGIITLNHSRCSKKDQFVKKIGRKIAYGRALKDHISIMDGRIRQSFKLKDNNIHNQVKDMINKYNDYLVQTI